MKQLRLPRQPLGRHRADLAVHGGVDLDTPRRRQRVGPSQIADGQLFGDHQIRLHISDQVFDQPFGPNRRLLLIGRVDNNEYG